MLLLVYSVLCIIFLRLHLYSLYCLHLYLMVKKTQEYIYLSSIVIFVITLGAQVYDPLILWDLSSSHAKVYKINLIDARESSLQNILNVVFIPQG